jgi:predicted TIM-barrel fold metal-dependent hydrolase
LVGIALSSLGLAEHAGSPTYWPIYQELERLNVPLLVHNVSYQGPGQDLRADISSFKIRSAAQWRPFIPVPR